MVMTVNLGWDRLGHLALLLIAGAIVAFLLTLVGVSGKASIPVGMTIIVQVNNAVLKIRGEQREQEQAETTKAMKKAFAQSGGNPKKASKQR